MHVHVLLKNNSMSEHVIYIYECVLQSVTYKPIKSHKMFEYKFVLLLKNSQSEHSLLTLLL